MSRIKGAGPPIDGILIRGLSRIHTSKPLVAESSYNERPVQTEQLLPPDYLRCFKAFGLSCFTALYNKNLQFIPHHRCHARAAAALSPFDEAILVVLDCGGNYFDAFDPGHEEARKFSPIPGRINREACTVYLQKGGELHCVRKMWQTLEPNNKRGEPPFKSDGLGWLYYIAARYIFQSRTACGKVMGLAPFGHASPIRDARNFFWRRGWNKAFGGGGKAEWQSRGSFQFFADIAASVQQYFEDSYLNLVRQLKEDFPLIDNLILTGGCALNCSANMKVFDAGLFRAVYVPPFPGDESIGFGAAQSLRQDVLGKPWAPVGWDRQIANFGPRDSVPTASACRRMLKGREARFVRDPASVAARMISDGKIIGWFQGRSESGPRALGFRSILADPRRKGMRDYLNGTIKGREAFRPYGCSVLWERAHEYFGVPKGFESPFMSFAPRVRPQYDQCLNEVRHVDGTSRIQTVRDNQNPLFHRLISDFGKKTGLFCVLNTSLNVMGEPIVETVGDALRLFESVPIDALFLGNFFIRRARFGSSGK